MSVHFKCHLQNLQKKVEIDMWYWNRKWNYLWMIHNVYIRKTTHSKVHYSINSRTAGQSPHPSNNWRCFQSLSLLHICSNCAITIYSSHVVEKSFLFWLNLLINIWWWSQYWLLWPASVLIFQIVYFAVQILKWQT